MHNSVAYVELTSVAPFGVVSNGIYDAYFYFFYVIVFYIKLKLIFGLKLSREPLVILMHNMQIIKTSNMLQLFQNLAQNNTRAGKILKLTHLTYKKAITLN